MNKFALLLSIGALVSQGEAQTVRDAIKSIEKSERQLPSYDKKKLETRNRVKVRVGKPVNTFSNIFPDGTAEGLYEKKLNQEISQLIKLSKRLNDGDTKRRILLKLAKSYSEKAALADRKAQDNYEKRLKLYLAGSIRNKPVLDMSDARKYSLRAVDIYKQYIRNYKTAKDADEVLFFLGYNYMSLGEVEKGIKYYERLSSKFSKSEYVPEANLSLGDYYFDKDRRSSAKHYYSKILNSPRSTSVRNLATYKMAWLNHKMGEHNEALKNIIKVIKFGDKRGTRNKKNIMLAEEAIKDLPMFYAEAGDPRKAFTYFTNMMSGKKVYDALEKLAYYYVDRGQREEAQYLFSKLIQMDPENQKSFDYQYSLVNMQASTGRDDLYERELYKWVKKFGPDSSWAKSTKDQKEKKEALNKAESALRSHVLKIHSEAREKKQKSLQLRADKGYQLYLGTFKNSEHTNEMQFYYGELLYEMGGYKEAYEAYAKVDKGSEFKSKAELNAVLSLEKVIPSDKEVREKVGKSTKKLELNSAEKAFVSSSKKYLEDPANKEKRFEIKYRLASLYYSHNYFERSEVLFKQIIKESPDSKYAKYASDLILDSYKLREDYEGLEKAGTELVELGTSSGASEVEVSKVKNIVEKSAFKKIEGRNSESNPEEVAKDFLSFAKKYPNSKLKNQALYNAGINFEKANNPQAALSSYSKIDRDAEGKLYLNAQKFSAIILENTGYLKQAAQRYEELGGVVKSKSQKAKYLSNAAVIREAFNETAAMQRIFNKLQPIDNPKDTFMYDYRLAEVYKRIGSTNQELRKRIEFFKAAKAEPFLLVNSATRIGNIYDERNVRDKASYWYRAADMTYQKYKNRGAEKAASAAARAKFKLSDKVFYRFLSIDIPKNQESQAKAITEKLSLIDKINKKMQEVIALDDGYSIVSSLNRLGQSYQHLTYSILNAPLPSGLSPEEVKQVEGMLQDKVKPFKKNAVSSYTKALEKAAQLETFNEDSLTTILELAKIDSDFANFKYPYKSGDTYMPYDKEFIRRYEIEESDLLKPEDFILNKYSEVLAKDKNNTKALATLAIFYSLKRMTGVSQLFLEKVEGRFKRSADFFNLKAFLNFTDNEPRVAVQNLKTALKISADSISAASNIGSYFVKYGGYIVGGDYLSRVYPGKKSRFFEASQPTVMNNFALSRIRRGQIDEAYAELKATLKEKENYLPAVANLAILDKVAKKLENSKSQYLSLYKKLAKTQEDFDRIKQLERD